MMIILSWNFSLGISFINQKRKPDKKQEKHTQWLKLRIIYRSDCAIGELLWKDIWYHFKGPDTLHGHGLLSTHLRVVCLSQFSSYTHSLITWKKKRTNSKTTPKANLCSNISTVFTSLGEKQLLLCLFWSPQCQKQWGVFEQGCKGEAGGGVLGC